MQKVISKRRVLAWCARLAGLWALLALSAGCIVNMVAFQNGGLRLDESWRPVEGEEIRFGVRTAKRLHGILLRAENPRGVVVYMHGNAGNVETCQWIAKRIRDRLNVTVFYWDYPGYGKSEGSPTPARVLATGREAVLVASELTGTPPEEIIITGQSLGAAVAVDAALHTNARALVIESGFTSLSDMAWRVFPLLPWGWILSEPMDSEMKIAEFKGVVFIAHGTADRAIPFKHGERLFKAANDPKEFYTGEGLGHNDPFPPSYWQALEKFLWREL